MAVMQRKKTIDDSFLTILNVDTMDNRQDIGIQNYKCIGIQNDSSEMCLYSQNEALLSFKWPVPL